MTVQQDPPLAPSLGFRIDQLIGRRLLLFARYNNSPSKISQRAIFATPNSIADTISNTQTTTAGATMNLSPRLINDLRFNYSRNRDQARSRRKLMHAALHLTAQDHGRAEDLLHTVCAIHSRTTHLTAFATSLHRSSTLFQPGGFHKGVQCEGRLHVPDFLI